MKILLRLVRILKMARLNLSQARLRAGLTTLGIIFGVCSVIAMLAVGEGASQEIQEQLARLGSRNIIIKSIKLPEEQMSGGQTRTNQVASYGLTYDDYRRFAQFVPNLRSTTPMKRVRYDVSFGERKRETNVVPTVPWYPDVTNHRMLRGRFISPRDLETQAPVCVVGARLARYVFPAADPLEKQLRVGGDLYRVVGIIGDVSTYRQLELDPLWYAGEIEDVFVPLTTYTQRKGDMFMKRSSGSSTFEKVELHEVVLTIDQQDNVMRAATAVRDVLSRYHTRQDYEIVVPLQLIRQAQETRRLFNIVLGSLAAISLLVGGIGIMNIMLATVLERTREIGIRRAIGARQMDIIRQFLTEAVLISIVGGLIGIGFGFGLSRVIAAAAGWSTEVTSGSIGVAFGVSVAIGLLFGIYPAVQAAKLDPIEAIRYE